MSSIWPDEPRSRSVDVAIPTTSRSATVRTRESGGNLS